MTISKNILDMSPQERLEFVEKRRAGRSIKEFALKKKTAKEQTVARLARDLGTQKHFVLKKIEEKLK